MQKFWNMVMHDEDGGADLYLEGEIADKTWYVDEVTPEMFRAELQNAEGRDITVWINSPGGDVFAASMIYTALMEHKGGVTVKIEGLAASAASVIAMAGDRVLMAPTAYMMIHDPWTVVCGNAEDVRHQADVLDEVAEGLVLAYQIKTGLSKNKLRQMMADETWMSAQTAIDNGFADALMTREQATPAQRPDENTGDKPVDRTRSMYGRVAACAWMRKAFAAEDTTPPPAGQKERDALMDKLAALRAAMDKINQN